MTTVGVLLALLAALTVGYLYGRYAATGTPTWRQRTTRVALGRRAAALAVLVAAAETQRRVERRLPAAPWRRGTRPVSRLSRRPASFRRW